MRIGTRGSALALAQTRLVTQRISPESLGGKGLDVVVVNTSGDALLSGEHGGGDKSRWVTELEHALLADEIDLAVHSAKDVPGEPVEGLELLGSPERAAAEDVLIGVRSLEQLPRHGCVGTSSVRRTAQLLAARPDLEVVSLRGNVDTRLRKLAQEVTGAHTLKGAGGGEREQPQPPVPFRVREPGHFDAIVLASAGLQRLGRQADVGCSLSVERFVPAPGQGALALQARVGDAATRAVVADLIDHDATASFTAERAVAHALGASCNTPLGAYAVPAGCGCLHMRAWVGLPDGSEWISDELVGGFYDPIELGQRMAERLRVLGADRLLRRAEAMAIGSN
ncbi:MAG TPA: hydroxymethylbilane synthase [Solirubrobacteraceae bacterium]|jgi:hydroxymethylbilane synthase|nr:hydroxymethylbilane synthase [Solirubrobacteraceae bacterium]